VQSAPVPSVVGWENFYVIVGSSAAALTGLMFVVITLSSETRARYPKALSAFSTPTVSHFCLVLLIAAVITIPRHSIISLTICLGLTGLAGLAYTSIVVLRIFRQKEYRPVLEDWVFHVVLPLLAYLMICVSVFFFWRRSDLMLNLIAACALLILYVGIHNAWDAAVFLALDSGAREPQPEKKGPAKK
jgi:hypothetical protein